MAVYLDMMRKQGMFYRGKRVATCHMLADTMEELFAMAEKIGMKKQWLHKDHFDLMIGKRNLAIKNGAIAVDDRREWSTIFR